MHTRVRGATRALPPLWHSIRQGCPSRGCPAVARPPLGIPQPTLASAVLHRTVRGRAGSVLLGNGQLSRLTSEKKIISLLYFSLYGVPAGSASAGI